MSRTMGMVPDTMPLPSRSAPPAPVWGVAKGLLEPGNIDIYNRPIVRNRDGSISTVRSASFSSNGKEVLVPTVSEDGRIMSNREAWSQYKRTGQHLGVFDTPQNATDYAKRLHEQQAAFYGQP